MGFESEKLSSHFVIRLLRPVSAAFKVSFSVCRRPGLKLAALTVVSDTPFFGEGDQVAEVSRHLG